MAEFKTEYCIGYDPENLVNIISKVIKNKFIAREAAYLFIRDGVEIYGVDFAILDESFYEKRNSKITGATVNFQKEIYIVSTYESSGCKIDRNLLFKYALYKLESIIQTSYLGISEK